MSFERVSRVPRPRVRNRNPFGSSASYAFASRPRSSDGRTHQQIDRPQPLPLFFRQHFDQLVDLPQLQRVAVELIEEDRVEQHAGDLRGRRISR